MSLTKVASFHNECEEENGSGLRTSLRGTGKKEMMGQASQRYE